MDKLDTSVLCIQLGQASVNPPDLCLKWRRLSGMAACKVKFPPLQAQVWGFTLVVDILLALAIC